MESLIYSDIEPKLYFEVGRVTMESLSPIQLQGLTEKWENFRLAAIIAGAIAAMVIGIAEYKIRYDIPAKLKVSKAQQLAELAKKEAYHWPVWFIEEQPNWNEVNLDSSEGRRLFVEQEEALPGAAATTQFVLKNGDHSELW